MEMRVRGGWATPSAPDSIHSMSDIFIVGTSGSLLNEDLTLLQGHRVFGLNTLPFYCPQLITDYVAIDMILGMIPEVRDSLTPGTKRYFSNWLWNIIPDEDIENTHIFTLANRSLDGFSFNPSCLYQAQTVAYAALQLAAQQAPSRIILLGIDIDNSQSHVPGADYFHRLVRERRLRDPMYDKRLGKHHPYSISEIDDRFHLAAKECAARGIEIINCSPYSLITAFPKRSLVDVIAAEPILT